MLVPSEPVTQALSLAETARRNVAPAPQCFGKWFGRLRDVKTVRPLGAAIDSIDDPGVIKLADLKTQRHKSRANKGG
jgi:hypothetical protein